MLDKTKYDLCPVEVKVPGDFSILHRQCRKIGIGIESMIDLYAHLASTDGTVSDPLRFTSLESFDDVKGGFPMFMKELDGILKKMRRIQPLQFMTAMTAHRWKKDNLTALENGLVYETYLEEVSETARMIFLDPSPYLVSQICEDGRLVGRDVRFAYSDQRFALIYASDQSLSRYHVSCVTDLKLRKDVYVLYCTGHQDANSILSSLEYIHSATKNCKTAKMNVLMSSANIETQKRGRSTKRTNVRPQILDMYTLQNALLFESSASKGGLKRKALIRLDRHSDQTKTVAFARAETHADCEPRWLEIQKFYDVDYSRIYDNDRTLIQLYNEGKRSSKTRSKQEVHNISPEIELRYNFHQLPSGHIRASIYWKDSVSKTVSKEERTFSLQKQVYDSKASLLVFIDDLPFVNLELRSKMIDSISRQEVVWQEEQRKQLEEIGPVGRMPLSLRTFYVVYVLGKSESSSVSAKGFDKAVCEMVFRGYGKADSEICKIVPGKTADEDVMTVVEQFCIRNALSQSASEDVWRQIHLIYTIAVKNGYLTTNPIQGMMDRTDKLSREIRNVRRNTTDITLSDTQEIDIVQHILTEEPHNKRLAVGMLIRLFYGTSVHVICALTWGDYRRYLDSGIWILRLTKRFGDLGTVPVPLSREQHFRMLPVIELLKVLLDDLRSDDAAWAELQGLSQVEFNKLPILHQHMEPQNPYTVDQMRRYEHKILSLYGPEEALMYISDGQGGLVVKDAGRYMGDFFAENFKFRALLNCEMDPEETHYILGLLPLSTLTKNYLALNKPTRMSAMKTSIERWASARQANFMSHNAKLSKTVIGTVRGKKIYTQPTCYDTEMVVAFDPLKRDVGALRCEMLDTRGMDINAEWIEED